MGEQKPTVDDLEAAIERFDQNEWRSTDPYVFAHFAKKWLNVARKGMPRPLLKCGVYIDRSTPTRSNDVTFYMDRPTVYRQIGYVRLEKDEIDWFLDRMKAAGFEMLRTGPERRGE